MDDLTRLLELPAVARLSAAGGELALLTLRHEHADKITIERRRLGTSIDLHELLAVIGGHGLADAPRVELSAPRVPELPAPAPDAPVPTVRRTRKHPASVKCPVCDRVFSNAHGLEVHRGRAHQVPETPVEPEPAPPEPEPAPPEPEPAPAPEPVEEQPPAPASRLGRFVCPYPDCGKEFRSQLGYSTHIEHAHTKDLPADAPTTPLREYSCTTCNTPLTGHLRCGDCQALLGPGHDAGPVHMEINGVGLCRVCVGYRGSAKKLLRMPT